LSGRDYWTASIGGLQVTCAVARDQAGQITELQANAGKLGSDTNNWIAALAQSISVGLRRGVPLSAYVHGLSGHCQPPFNGETGDPLAPRCMSLQDYLSKALEARA